MKAGILAGRSIKGLAKDLGVSRPSVQEHVQRLLSDGEVIKTDGRFFPGPGRGGAGRKEHAEHAPVQVPNTQGPAPPTVRVDEATDGKRVFRITRPPELVTSVPGFARSKTKGQRKNRAPAQLLHKVEYVTGGRTWNLWLEQGLKTGTWTAWVGAVKPAPRFAEFQRDGEDPDDAWDRLTIQTVVEWATKAGVGLEPIPRRARPVSVTYPGIVEGASWRSAPSDADQTPPDPSGRLALEVRGRELQEFVNGGPEWKRVYEAELEAVRSVLSKSVKVQVVAAEVVAGLTSNTSRHLANSANEGVSARGPTASLRPPSPWEFV